MTEEEKRKKKAEQQRRYYLANREAISERNRRYRNANPGKQVAADRRRKYGISQDQYNSIFTAQNSSCAICLSVEAGGRGSFHVDHCHSTGKVRGLLCHHCNVGLGYFRDSVPSLLRATEYLNDRHQETLRQD